MFLIMNKDEAKGRVKPAEESLAIGVCLAAVGISGSHVIKQVPNISSKINEALKSLCYMAANRKYYKGGFEKKMTKREACLILGVSATASNLKVKEAHKRVMLLNHPDKGGSPYLAAKINEAKDCIGRNKLQ